MRDLLVCLPKIMGKIEFLELFQFSENAFDLVSQSFVSLLLVIEIFGSFGSIVYNL